MLLTEITVYLFITLKPVLFYDFQNNVFFFLTDVICKGQLILIQFEIKEIEIVLFKQNFVLLKQ